MTVFRIHKGVTYSWRDCGRGEFNCSLSYSNVIVSRRTDSLSQSGQYHFHCGARVASPPPAVTFCVEVGGAACHLSLTLPLTLFSWTRPRSWW